MSELKNPSHVLRQYNTGTSPDRSIYICPPQLSNWLSIPKTLIDANIHSPIEAWCCAFSSTPTEPQIYTGGDDSTLRITGISNMHSAVENGEDITTSSKSQNSRAHDAGVTAILPLPGTQFLVTGSYDEHIRLFSGDFRGRKLPFLPVLPMFHTSLY